MDNNRIKNWVSNVLRNFAKGSTFSDELVDEGFDILSAMNEEKKIKIFGNYYGFFYINIDQWSGIQVRILSNQKIPAIKTLQEITKWGLKEAKEAVEDSDNWRQPVLKND
ncbi:MAG TPA: ribosomal protein L7/L12 [Candidatus Glassbacteria bacterium]|nr:ribosomal protein L7/L12 [Candidatus Glassbacteria bacterium]